MSHNEKDTTHSVLIELLTGLADTDPREHLRHLARKRRRERWPTLRIELEP